MNKYCFIEKNIKIIEPLNFFTIKFLEFIKYTKKIYRIHVNVCDRAGFKNVPLNVVKKEKMAKLVMHSAKNFPYAICYVHHVMLCYRYI